MNQNEIFVKGARTHNLKDVSVSLPKNSITAIMGPSGAGKTSLAYDTLFAEGSRKYIQSLSGNQQFFLNALDAADVDVIVGLTPTVAIQGNVTSCGAHATMGTVCDLDRYIRILFAGLGEVYCPECNKKLSSHTISDIVDYAINLEEGAKVEILSPVSYDSGVTEKEKLKQNGFVRVRVENELIDINDWVAEEVPGKCHVVIDRIKIKEGIARRATDSIETAAGLSGGSVILCVDGEDVTFSERNECSEHAFSVPVLNPKMFSLSNKDAVCVTCQGDGELYTDTQESSDPDSEEYDSCIVCPECNGAKYAATTRAIVLNQKPISEIQQCSVDTLIHFFSDLSIEKQQKHLFREVLHAIDEKLLLLKNIGLAYLQCGRSARSLSQGELQRVAIVGQMGVGLSGLTYIIDEPTSALHPLDARHVITAITSLKEAGNTVIVIDHNEEMIDAAEYIIELGPKGGRTGGTVVWSGTALEYAQRKMLAGSLSQKKNELKGTTKFDTTSVVTFKEVRGHNLKGGTIEVPLNGLTAMCGVSGSGKSSFGLHTLYPFLKNAVSKKIFPVLPVGQVTGGDSVERVVLISKSASGFSRRANLATYTKIFDIVRMLFGKTPESKVRGYGAGRFSYNVKGGRCERCKGEGVEKVDLPLMLANGASCSVCNGTRYGRDILEILYKGKNISEILEMDVEQAMHFYRDIPKIRKPLELLTELGLEYLPLGQTLNTFSTGELRRLKLAADISVGQAVKTLYVLDEPSRSLHNSEVHLLNAMFKKLIKEGHSLFVIDHHPLIISQAQWVIELGPLGGTQGGDVVYQGTVQDMHSSELSQMKQYL